MIWFCVYIPRPKAEEALPSAYFHGDVILSPNFVGAKDLAVAFLSTCVKEPLSSQALPGLGRASSAFGLGM